MSTGYLKKPSRPPPPPPPPRKDAKSDYIMISECHSGLPGRPKTVDFIKSATLKPSSSNHMNVSNHQKSRSLMENHSVSAYLYLEMPSSKNDPPMYSSTVYKTVDFLKTEALTKCKQERTGRALNQSR